MKPLAIFLSNVGKAEILMILATVIVFILRFLWRRLWVYIKNSNEPFFEKRPIPSSQEIVQGIRQFIQAITQAKRPILRSLIFWIMVSIPLYFMGGFIIGEILLAPFQEDFVSYKIACWLKDLLGNGTMPCSFVPNVSLIAIPATSQSFFLIKVALLSGFILSIPFFCWEAWKHIQRRNTSVNPAFQKPFIGNVSIGFYIGVAIGYWQLAPLSIQFFSNFRISPNLSNSFPIDKAAEWVLSLTWPVGLLIATPGLIYFLSKMGLLHPVFFRKYVRQILIVLLFMAALMSPPDLFSQLIIGIFLFGMYVVCRLIAFRYSAVSLD